MHDFTLVVLPGAFASAVAASLDILRAAEAVAPRLKLAPPRWRVVAPAAGEVALGGGLRLRAGGLPRTPDASTWILPGLGTESAGALRERLCRPDARRVIAALRRHLAGGGLVGAACASVFLLQAAGALAGRRATTSWWLGPELQRLDPSCTVSVDRMICVDGPVTTAGAAFAQVDLMLQLLQARFGAALPATLRRLLVIDARQAQSSYVLPSVVAGGDALAARVAERIESSLPRPPSVPALAREFAMSQRTLGRQLRAATGMTPLALLQTVRLNRARMLIETTRMSIEQVAVEVGYEDATALRRLMRRRAGMKPSSFRAPPAAG